MAISLLAYVATFSDSLIFGKARMLSSLIFLVKAAAFFEELLFQNSHFFSAFFFFFENSYFFTAKLLPSSHFLRIRNSLVQFLFGTATYRRYLQKSYFFEAGSSAQHQLFQKSHILGKSCFFRKAIFRITYFFWRATFTNRYLLYQLLFQKSYFFTTYLFRRVTISQLFSTATN